MEPSEVVFDGDFQQCQTKLADVHYRGGRDPSTLPDPEIALSDQMIDVSFRRSSVAGTGSTHWGRLVIRCGPLAKPDSRDLDVSVKESREGLHAYFTVRIRPRRSFALSPSFIYVGVVQPGQKCTANLLISSSNALIRSVEAVCNAAEVGLEVKLCEFMDPSFSKLVRINLAAPMSKGVFSIPATFEINGSSTERYTVEIKGLCE